MFRPDVSVYDNACVQALKRYEEAAPLHQKAHALFTEVGHATGMDLAAKNLGVCQANMPRLPTPQQGSSLTGDGVSRDELLRQPDSPSAEESGVTPEELPEPWVGHGRPVQRVHRAHGAVYGSTRLAEASAPQHDGKGNDASVPRQKQTPAERVHRALRFVYGSSKPARFATPPAGAPRPTQNRAQTQTRGDVEAELSDVSASDQGGDDMCVGRAADGVSAHGMDAEKPLPHATVTYSKSNSSAVAGVSMGGSVEGGEGQMWQPGKGSSRQESDNVTGAHTGREDAEFAELPRRKQSSQKAVAEKGVAEPAGAGGMLQCAVHAMGGIVRGLAAGVRKEPCAPVTRAALGGPVSKAMAAQGGDRLWERERVPWFQRLESLGVEGLLTMGLVCQQKQDGSGERAGDGVEQGVGREAGSMGVLLDLDNCAIFGQDGNDLGLALQMSSDSMAGPVRWPRRGGKGPQQRLVGLYQRLVNPQAAALCYCLGYKGGTRKAGAGTRNVVIYTRRAHLLEYYSEFRHRVLSLRWCRTWHIDSTHFAIPASVATASEILETYTGPRLLPRERRDIELALERLLAARDAVQVELGLACPPVVVVTSVGKDVKLVQASLGLPRATFLWDDDVQLAGYDGVLVTARYEVMARTEAQELSEFLGEVLPPRKLSRDAARLLASAQPSLLYTGGGPDELQWRIPWSPQRPRPFALPPMSAAGGGAAGAARAGKGAGARGSEATSVAGAVEQEALATSARLPGSYTPLPLEESLGSSVTPTPTPSDTSGKTPPDASGDMAGAPAAEGGEGGVRRGEKEGLRRAMGYIYGGRHGRLVAETADAEARAAPGKALRQALGYIYGGRARGMERGVVGPNEGDELGAM